MLELEENFGVVASSEENFKNACREKGLKSSEVYPIFNFKDLIFMLEESEKTRVVLIFALDYMKTGVSTVKDVAVAKVSVKEHNMNVSRLKKLEENKNAK